MIGRYRCLAVLAFLAIAAPAQTQARELIKLGTLAPEGSPWHETLREIAEQWSALSGGEIELRIYAGGVAGDENDTVRKMRVGQLQAAALSSRGLGDLAPEFCAYLLPLVFANYRSLASYTSNAKTSWRIRHRSISASNQVARFDSATPTSFAAKKS